MTMSASDSPAPTRLCPVCAQPTSAREVDRFRGGGFFQCARCAVQYAASDQCAPAEYYENLWGRADSGEYHLKAQAAHDAHNTSMLLAQMPRYRWAVRHLRRLALQSRVLDIGCGEGSLLWAAQKLGLEPHGCDVAPEACRLARGLVKGATIHEGSFSELEYAPGTFDCIVALEILEHLADPHSLLRFCAARLKPSGALLLTTPNRRRFFTLVRSALGRPHASTDYPPHHWTRWSGTALRRFLGGYFEHVRLGELPYYFRSQAGRALAVLLHVACARRLGQSLWAAARKPRK